MNPFATSWVFHLLVGGAQAAAVGLIALVIVRATPRSSTSWRHAILVLALVKFAVPPMIPLPFGAFTVVTPVVRPAFAGAESSLRAGNLALILALVHIAGMFVIVIRFGFAVRSWRSWVTSSLADARLSSRLRAIHERSGAASSPRRLPEVRVSSAVPVPMAGGLFRPVILLPAAIARETESDRIDLVLRHELEHHNRHDPWWNLAGSILQVIWWWHPVFLALLREARRLREERCDDAIVAAAPAIARFYAHALIDMAPRATSRAVPMLACAATGSLFEHRLRRLLTQNVVRRARLAPLARLAIAVVALVTLPGLKFARFDIRLPLGTTRTHGAAHAHAHGPHSAPDPGNHAMSGNRP